MWLESLTPEQAAAVDALARRAEAADGFDPLNEEARLTRSSASARHLLVTDGGLSIAYLIHSLEHATAQLVVDPARRRQGIGSSLAATLAVDAPLRLWAFRDAAPARGFAGRFGLVAGRALLVMERALWTAPAGPGAVPPPQDGVRLRSFTAADTDALLAVNAAAFAHHPEQGGLDAAGLAARTAEDWFDPTGLILAVEDDRVLGFHWTKRHPDDTGEVYMIGVDPAAQGRGLGRRLLAAGLDHLARTGCRRVILYVDSADSVAVQMYESAGFGIAHRDVLYVPAGKE
ncbi:MAG: mycothiol synthase [Propionicimonas sp.]|nr:mycothiol synthase [Propionicimonas sp.]